MILGIADHPSFETQLNEFLAFASKLKAEVVELRLDRPELLSSIVNASKKDKNTVRSILGNYNFKWLVHASSIGVNFASLNPILRKASEETVLRAVRFAAEIHAELIVTHVGRLSRDYSEKYLDKALEKAINSLKRINIFSKDLGVILTIENDHKERDHILAGYAEQIKFLVENVGCKLTFDVGHANTFGKPERFAELLREHILNIHLHDNDGLKDSHLPLGRGKINFKEVFRKIGVHPNLPMVLECHSLKWLEESLNFARQRLNHQ